MAASQSDTNELRNNIIKQLNRICHEKYRGNASEMAEDAQVSQSKMSRLLHGKQEKIDPYLGVAADIADAQSIELSQVTTPAPARPQKADMQALHAYCDVEIGARDTRSMTEWPFEDVNVPTRIARQLVGQDPPDEVGLVQVRGESMYPEIQDGDWVLFTPTERLVDGGTFLIRMDGALLLKNLQRKAGNRVRIHCFNEDFEDDIIRKDSGGWVTDDHRAHAVEFEVVGKFLNVIQEKELYRSSQRVKEALKAHTHMNGTS